MSMTVLKLTHHGEYRVIYSDHAPYVIKYRWFDAGWHSKIVAKYTDLKSCLLHLACIVDK